MDLFAARRVPYMARRNYVTEIQHLLLWGLFAGTFEGTVSSVVAAKTFNADWLLITIVMATPMVANLMGLAWGSVSSGRRKLPIFTLFAIATTAMIGSIALAPAESPYGGWIYAGQILLARMMLSGCMTVRASLWKHNYPQHARGRIAARLQFVRFSMSISTVTCMSLLFDFRPSVYVYVYPIAAVVGVIAIFTLRRLHVRGEPLEMRQIADHAGDPGSHSRAHPVRSMIQVLRADPYYARYCIAMTLLGSANMMLMPVMTIIVTKELYLNYYHSCNLMEILPRVLMMGSIMLWAGLFDRVGAIRFRVWNSLVWGAGALFGGIGAFVLGHFGIDSTLTFTIVVSAVALARLCQGAGMGGGAIAWNIGHLHFAKPEKAEIYMGIHVTLTGVRGLVSPFLGTALYALFGWPAFAVALALSLAGTLSFRALAKTEREDQRITAAKPPLLPTAAFGPATPDPRCLSARES